MFPIDFNLLITILIVTTISGYVFILKKLKTKSISTNKIPAENSKKHDPETRRKDKNMETESQKSMQSKISQSGCSHYFGYLRTLPKNASLPDECLGCPNIIECLTRARIKKSRVKQK